MCKESINKVSCQKKTVTDKILFFLFLIFLAGFLLRLCWLFYAQPVPVSDFLRYKMLAINLWDKHHFGMDEPTALRTPGYPFFLAGCMIVSRTDLWLRFVNVCLSVAICAEVYFLTVRLFHQKAAIWASLLCLLNPAFVLYSPVLASEHLYSVLVLGSLLLAWPLKGRGTFRICLSGLFLGLSILVRGAGLFYIPLLATLAFWPANSNGRRLYRLRFYRVAILLVITVCCLIPWYLRNARVMGPGAGLSTTPGLNFYYGHNPIKYGYFPLPQEIFGGLDEVQSQRLAFRLGWEHIKENPFSILESIFLGTVKLYEPSTYGINWSTRTVLHQSDGTWATITRPLAGRLVLKGLSIVAYCLLLLGVLLSLINRQDWSRLSVLVVGGVIFLNWVGLAVISLAIQRYHYFVEIFFCIICGTVLARFCRRFSDVDTG